MERRRSDGVPRIDLDRATCSSFAGAIGREWLVTNGLGGYASGTVAGAATRRYHGLLVAALAPPLGRTLLVAGLNVDVEYQGQSHALSAHEFADGTVHPDGFRHTEGFMLNGGMPVWTVAIGDARLTRSIWMGHGTNTTFVRLRLESASGPVRLRIAPLCTYRDHHGHSHGDWQPAATAVPDGIRIDAFPGARSYRVLCAGAAVEVQGNWFWNFQHRLEAERGLSSTEDLYCPGTLSVDCAVGGSVTVICTAEPGTVEAPAAALSADHHRRAGLLLPVVREPGWVRQLALAADQFVVNRPVADGSGATIMAGYPWFGDWGRDTMIALPGLTLHTGRPDVAARILRTFSDYLSDGMLPNRFPEDGAQPEYNTVDATLWYFHAVEACWRVTGDDDLVRELWPRLTEIIDWHLQGTRYGIGVDPADGLLRAGEPGVQLTWMDAKVGDRVVTPRIGKPVEINSLWHNALLVMASLAGQVGDPVLVRRYQVLADRVRDSFRTRFWYAAGHYLYDVIDGPDGDDASLRPNQILAVSLSPQLLDEQQAAAVVAVCRRELLTPMGLRSLAPSDARYVGHYSGGPAERDGAYHQGTVWSWLLGPFALAHFRVHGNRPEAQALLAGIGSHLAEACVGSVSEVFDGNAPHRPRGCCAQAWSVAEVLRAWFELKERA
ncbi:MAG: amylo-alpha-1,6-glucosidase [Gammaproteobacteria bacterium]|nr:amylo-alpha-1,6-glucosidase [Gammaproteobacteria bacterium]